MCKTPFHSVIHNVRANDDYEKVIMACLVLSYLNWKYVIFFFDGIMSFSQYVSYLRVLFFLPLMQFEIRSKATPSHQEISLNAARR